MSCYDDGGEGLMRRWLLGIGGGEEDWWRGVFGEMEVHELDSSLERWVGMGVGC